MDLTGTLAIVTGAASGLGNATARLLAERGAQLALIDLREEGMTNISQETGALSISCDVADASASEAAFAHILAVCGVPRMLVNCAGIAPGARIVDRGGPGSLVEFERIVRINLIGTYNWLRLAAAAMTGNAPDAEGQRGVIINTASIAAYEGQIGQTAYAASKGGVASLTLPAARELARHGIRVAAIAPGLFGTPMVEAMTQEVQDRVLDAVPFPKRPGRPDEFAQMVLGIVANPMVNGSVFRLDGGLRMLAR
ncbi:SDR family NAD(P)-dependent oxidoreductase [Xanthobacter sp. DSM 24535]|uniref:SDR family NAD(P)-dependent oxidoreductase n=1 Tax=Roseixanthobacter psychrophilus TaxID=3119917 RepID=UPI00372A5F44